MGHCKIFVLYFEPPYTIHFPNEVSIQIVTGHILKVFENQVTDYRLPVTR